MSRSDTPAQATLRARARSVIMRRCAEFRSNLLPAGLALVACSLLVACGGDDAPEAADAPAGTSEAPIATPTASAAASPTAGLTNASPTTQPATSANPLDDPCSLLTTDEVRSLIGDANAPTATKARGVSACAWESVGSRTRVVNIIIETNVAAWRRDIDGTIGRGAGTPVDVGEAAFVSTERVVFVKGGFAVQVQVLSLPGPSRDALVALGKAIAARL